MNRAALVVLFAATAALHLWGAERAYRFWPSLAVHGVATVAWLVLVWSAVRGTYRPTFAQAFLVAAALRAIALPLEPSLSDDYFRYLHEGNLVLHGENPYLHAPAELEVAEYRGAYWDHINNPDIPAAYPPAVQWSLALAAWLDPGAQQEEQPFPWAVKLVFGGFDLLVFVALWSWLGALGLGAYRAVVHGFCPLMVLEFAGEGHSDSLAVLFMVLALLAATRGRSAVAAGCLAVATAGKLLPVVLLPFLRGRWPWLVTSFVAVLVLLYLPFLGEGMLEGTTQYTARWRNNDSLFALLMAAVESVFISDRDGVLTTGFVTGWEAQWVAKVPLALMGFGLLVLAFWRRWPAHKAGAAFFLFFIAMAPTVHPWYLVLLLPFLCVYPNPGWLAFCGTVYLSYHVLPEFQAARDRGEPDLGRFWVENTWFKVVEYAPFYLGFLWCLVRSGPATNPATATGTDRSPGADAP